MRHIQALEALNTRIEACTRCQLHEWRTNVVVGEGNPRADLVLVGEGPGQNEDETGRPFVGRAGKLLNACLKEAGTSRKRVYILNAVKCRPPSNRKPEPKELAACRPYLTKQISIIAPSVIVTLGATATSALLHLGWPISSLRGSAIEWKGKLVVPTWHPAYVLRTPHEREKLVEDLRYAVQLLAR